MRNFKIVLQYEGTRYKGWQKQGKGEGDSSSSASPENTIQGKLERLLSRIAGKPVEIQGSGRTDAGVHAYGQVANFHMDTDDTPEALMEKINSYLPEDIGVISVEEVPERFHSRLNAKSKTYRYRVLNSAVPHIFERRYVYQVPEHLDMEAMRRAALLLTGSHDFKAFTSAKKEKINSAYCRFHSDRPCGGGNTFHLQRKWLFISYGTHPYGYASGSGNRGKKAGGYECDPGKRFQGVCRASCTGLRAGFDGSSLFLRAVSRTSVRRIG